MYRQHDETIAGMVSTTAIVLAGLLSGMIALLSTRSGWRSNHWRNGGGYHNFLGGYTATLVALIILHLLSIASLHSYFWFVFMLAWLCVCTMLLGWLWLIVYFHWQSTGGAGGDRNPNPTK